MKKALPYAVFGAFRFGLMVGYLPMFLVRALGTVAGLIASATAAGKREIVKENMRHPARR